MANSIDLYSFYFILQLELFSSWDFLVEAKAEANGGFGQYPKWEQVEVCITF